MAQLNADLNKSLWFEKVRLFNGEAGYNQTYAANATFSDYDMFLIYINWKPVMCMKTWYSDTQNVFSGSVAYADAGFSDLYRFEIIFSNVVGANSFYTNVLSRTRIYSNGTYEYNYSDIKLQAIEGIRPVKR